MNVPETRYAITSDGVHIAYQVFGDGSHDLLSCPGFVFNVDAVWRLWPKVWVDLFQRLATFSRVILFDRRGTGLSGRIVGGDQMSLEARMDDIRAVMDAVSRSGRSSSASRTGSACARCSRPRTPNEPRRSSA